MIVVDASVVAKWLFPTEVRAANALALLTDTFGRQEPIYAPPLLAYEITNLVRQRMIRQGLSLPLGQSLIAQFLVLPIIQATPPTMHEQALALSDAYGLPAAYDAHYLALAQHLGCDFWTDDQRLLRLLSGALSFVQSLDGYPSP
jgi:predicted nucleic acid-binding protein